MAGPSDVAGALVDVRAVRGWLDAVEADLAKRQSDLAETLGAAPAADVLGRSGKTSRRSAERIAQRAAALADAPSMAAGLAGGAISAEHADVFASVTGRVDDAVRIGLFDIEHELTADAAGRTPEQFRRRLNERVRDMSADVGVGRSEQQREQARVHIAIDECSGMGEIRGELHPDDYQRVARRLDAAVAALQRDDEHRHLRRDQLRAVALVNLICSGRAGATARHERSAPRVAVDVPGVPSGTAARDSIAARSTTAANGAMIRAPPTSSSCSRSACTTTTDSTRGDGGRNSTRAPDDSR